MQSVNLSLPVCLGDCLLSLVANVAGPQRSLVANALAMRLGYNLLAKYTRRCLSAPIRCESKELVPSI